MRFLFMMLFGFSVHAQQVDLDAEQKGFATIERAGKLVSIRVKPHAKGLELFLVGKDAAQIKSLKDWNVEASQMEGKISTPLVIEKMAESFVIEQPKTKRAPVRLKVRTLKDESESFQLDMTPK